MRPSAHKAYPEFAGEHSMWFLPVITPIRRHPPPTFQGEPPLEHLLNDPILKRLIASDGISTDDLLILIDTAQRNLS